MLATILAMQNQPIDYSAAEAVLRAKRQSVIVPGTTLDRAFFDWCARVEFGMVEIMSLFPKGNGEAAKNRYPTEFQCPTCQQWRLEAIGKKAVSNLISAAKSGELSWRHTWEFNCDACTRAEKEAREKAYDPDHLKKFDAQIKSEQREKARQRTPQFIECYLDPKRRWNSEVSVEQRFWNMTREQVDGEMLGTAIRSLAEGEFWKTPYWTAIHGEAMRRAGNKCSICTRTEGLRIYHRGEQKLGFQHTEEGMREHLCLCERCRNTHMLKTFSPNN